MAQQLNLYHPRFAPRPLRWSAQQGAVLVACCLGIGGFVVAGLQWAVADTLRKAQALSTASGPLRQRLIDKARRQPVLPVHDHEAELAQLKRLEAGQRRIRAALDAGAAGSREGRSDYLVSLARQANGQVWITGFSISEGDDLLLLDGRMSDPAALTDYLRRLNAEPRFRGRPFAQLALQAVNTPDGRPLYTEFSLRATAPAPSTTRPMAHGPNDLDTVAAVGDAGTPLRTASSSTVAGPTGTAPSSQTGAAATRTTGTTATRTTTNGIPRPGAGGTSP